MVAEEEVVVLGYTAYPQRRHAMAELVAGEEMVVVLGYSAYHFRRQAVAEVAAGEEEVVVVVLGYTACPPRQHAMAEVVAEEELVVVLGYSVHLLRRQAVATKAVGMVTFPRDSPPTLGYLTCSSLFSTTRPSRRRRHR